MKIIALIPARGGSKRLPKKNIVSFCGRPLIEWTIRFALNSGVFTGVYVSTDDIDIADISVQSGALTINRPENLASDYSTTAEVAYHAYLYLADSLVFDWMCILQPTSPLRPASLMSQVRSCLSKISSYDSIMTVSECKHKIGRISPNGHFQTLGYKLGQRSQDVDFFYYENGLMYVVSAELLIRKRIFGDRVLTIETDQIYNLDIDDWVDLQIGEFMFQANKEKFAYLLEES